MGFLKNLWDKFKNRNLKQLIQAEIEHNMFFTTNDGIQTDLRGIKEQTPVRNENGYTKLYSASLLRGSNILATMDTVCFELPSDMPLEQAEGCIQYLVSTVYNNQNTNGRNESYYHMGVINYDENGQLQMFNPSNGVLNWVNDNMNEPLRNKRMEVERQKQEYEARSTVQMEEEHRKQIERGFKQQEEKRIEKENRYNNPIFRTETSLRGDFQYTFYQQPDINDPSQYNGLTSLRKVEKVLDLQHGDGKLGYVYSAHVFNHSKESDAERVAAIYPKVCFELPYPIEQMEQRLQMGDKSVIQVLGKLTSDRNLTDCGIKFNGEQTWIGRIATDERGQSYINNSISTPIQEYISKENDIVRNMNTMGNNSYQQARDNGDRGKY